MTQTYVICTESRAGVLTALFLYEFSTAPLIGDTIVNENKTWVVERRQWGVDGVLSLIVRPNSGVVRC